MSTQLDLERASDALWQLRPGEARRLPASSSTRWLRLRDGAMWITADGRVHAGARSVLSAAALTYVAAALASLAQLAYFALQFFGNNR